MSNTGWKSPTITGETYSYWMDPENAYSSDGAYAHENAMGGEHKQDYSGFGFNIPQNVNITGIEVALEFKKSTTGPIGQAHVIMALSPDGGSTWTNEYYQSTDSTTNVTVIYPDGSPGLWGRQWEPSEFLDSNFSLYIFRDSGAIQYHTGADPMVDHIQVRVHYVVTPTIGTKYPLPAFGR